MKKILNDYRLEITALVIGLLGVILVSQRGRIEAFLKDNYSMLVQSLDHLNQTLAEGLQQFLRSLSLSELAGWLLLLLAIPFVIYRIRYRFTRSDHWRASVCPRCGGELHRRHRTLIDRLLSHTLLPDARRYRCEKTACGWSGLRRRRHLDHFVSPLEEATGSTRQ